MALRRAVERRGVTLAWLHERLSASGNPVSMATLSYWRSGRRHPHGAASLAALEEIECVLGLDRGTLVDRVTPRGRLARMTRPTAPPSTSPRPWQHGVDVLEALGSTTHEQFHEVSTHVVAVVGDEGRVISERYRFLFQSRQDVIAEMPVVQVTESVSSVAPTFTALAGCRQGRTYDHGSGQAFGVVFELDHPLPPQETALVEFRVDYPAGFPPVSTCSHATTRPVNELLVWVQFAVADPPTWVERFSIVDDTDAGDLVPLRGDSVHAAWHRDGAGEFGIRWGW